MASRATRPDAGPYAEVWGDTVVLADLGRAVLIGAVIALACYLSAAHVLAELVATPQVARTDAMLFGLVGCIAAGAICARLFAPKRDLDRQARDDAWREEMLDQLPAEFGVLGRTADLPRAVQDEMRAVGLHDAFLRREARGAELIP